MDHQFIAPALALVGTLLVAALGFYQWRKQNANPNRAANAAARRDAYLGLWNRLEEINLALRKSDGKTPGLNDLLRSINEYFLGHSLYFDDADQAVINQYVSALHVMKSMLDDFGDVYVKEQFNLTGDYDASKVDALVRASDEVQKYRAIIKEKAMKVAGSV